MEKKNLKPDIPQLPLKEKILEMTALCLCFLMLLAFFIKVVFV